MTGSLFQLVGLSAIHYRLTGAGGQTVVEIHGFGCTGDVFTSAQTSSALAGFRQLLVDLPGHGQSGKSNFGYDHRLVARVLAELVAEVAPLSSRVSVIAHSMGALPGLLLGAELAAKGYEIGALVLIEGVLKYFPDHKTVISEAAGMTAVEYEERGLPALMRALLASGRADERQWAEWLSKARPEALRGSALSAMRLIRGDEASPAIQLFNGWPGGRSWYLRRASRGIDPLKDSLRSGSIIDIGGMGSLGGCPCHQGGNLLDLHQKFKRSLASLLYLKWISYNLHLKFSRSVSCKL